MSAPREETVEATLRLLEAGGLVGLTPRQAAWVELCGASAGVGIALARMDNALAAYGAAKRDEEAT